MDRFEDIKQKLVQESQQLSRLISELESRLEKAPSGSLRITHREGNPFYYWRNDAKDTRGTYITKKDTAFIRALAQKEYDIKLLRAAKERQNAIKMFLKKESGPTMDDLYVNMSAGRKQLITPYRLPAEEYVKQWQEQKYTGKAFAEDMSEIYTERGERVRSKSEKILADKFYLRGIPYRYEFPLKLKGYGIVYPDFTLLNSRTGQEYYWEHFGLMDDEEYREKAIRKIGCYEKSGYFSGEKLLVTFETAKTALDMKLVEHLIDRYLV